MKLVIAEKPSVAQSYASVLGAANKQDGYFEGNGYIVSWALGHLAGFEVPTGTWSLENLPVSFSGVIVPLNKDNTKQFQTLKKLMSRSDVTSLVNGADAGREGEAIFRYIYEAAGCSKPFERLWISSMTDEAIREGFANLQDGQLYDNLYEAAKARDNADSIVGINGTRLFSLLYKQGGFYKTQPLTVGRVQTPTLSMIVNRENDIKNFVKQKFFKVHILADVDGNVLEAISRNIDTEEEANAVASQCGNNTATVTEVIKELKSQAAPRLYDLTSLQRDCNSLYGYTAQETLDCVQSLYESKLCTYPRTDSKYLSDDMEDTAKSVAEAVLETAPFVPSVMFNPITAKVLNSKKVSDHHAIIPTEEVSSLDWNSLSEEKYNVLGLISTRLLAAMALPYQYQSTKVILDCAGETFKATGKVETDEGYKVFERAYKEARNTQKDDETEDDAEKRQPEVTEGAKLPVQSQLSEHFTQPPKSFTEATLLTAMEKAGAEDITEEVERQGLGTTATRAAIIENLIDKGYVVRQKKKLLPTERGIKLISVVPDKLKTPKLTADMENTLSLVAKGQASAESFLIETQQYITDIINANRYTIIQDDENPFGKPAVVSSTEVLGHCPNCNGEVKSGKYGAYCTKKCGMNIGKHFNKQLTDTQVKALLSGKSVAYTSNGYKNTIFSEIQESDYTTKEGKKGYQWKSKGEKVSK